MENRLTKNFIIQLIRNNSVLLFYVAEFCSVCVKEKSRKEFTSIEQLCPPGRPFSTFGTRLTVHSPYTLTCRQRLSIELETVGKRFLPFRRPARSGAYEEIMPSVHEEAG